MGILVKIMMLVKKRKFRQKLESVVKYRHLGQTEKNPPTNRNSGQKSKFLSTKTK